MLGEHQGPTVSLVYLRCILCAGSGPPPAIPLLNEISRARKRFQAAPARLFIIILQPPISCNLSLFHNTCLSSPNACFTPSFHRYLGLPRELSPLTCALNTPSLINLHPSCVRTNSSFVNVLGPPSSPQSQFWFAQTLPITSIGDTPTFPH